MAIESRLIEAECSQSRTPCVITAGGGVADEMDKTVLCRFQVNGIQRHATLKGLSRADTLVN